MPILSPRIVVLRGFAVGAGLTLPIVAADYAAGRLGTLLVLLGAALLGSIKVGVFCGAVAWVACRRPQPPAPPAPVDAFLLGAAVAAVVLGAGYAYANRSDDPSHLILGALVWAMAGGVASGVVSALTGWIMRPFRGAPPAGRI